MKYRISKEALVDLEKVWLHTFENWSAAQADRYFNLIMDKIECIAQTPELGKDCSDIREGYFRLRVKSHFIFYKINLPEAEVEIIRILHQQMDIESRLSE